MAELRVEVPEHLLKMSERVMRLLDISQAEAVIRALEGYYIEDRPVDLIEAGLRQGFADIAAGRTVSLDELPEKARREIGTDADHTTE